MPSQIVVLPESTLNTVASLSDFQLDVAFGSRDMQTQRIALTGGKVALRVDVDRVAICPDVSNRLHDDVYAILIISDPSTLKVNQPAPLPTTVVQNFLGEAEAALLSLPRICGHDKLAIVSGFAEARVGRPMILPTSRGANTEAAPTERLQRAADLEKMLKPELDRLDGKLAQYGAFVRKHGLELAVTRLGLQADLGAALRLDLSNGHLVLHLARRHRRGSIHDLWHATQNTLATFEAGLNLIHSSTAYGGGWIDRNLLSLHSTLLRVIAPPFNSGRFRSSQTQIRAAFGRDWHAPGLSADLVPAAVDAFAAAFDRHLWKDIHPFLRAGMGHIELMAIHPFVHGNGRLGRLLLLLMLIEDFVPGLPLEAIFTWNRESYLERVDAAVRKDDLLSFMQFLLRAIDKAMELGRSVLPNLARHRDSLMPVLGTAGIRFATVATEHAASMLLGPDEQFAVRAQMDPNALCGYLTEAGLDPVDAGAFDLIGHSIPRSWSSPVARDLLIAPPARI